jgi:hypothetical protein
MAEQLPETPFERVSEDARDKERLDRQKVLVSLPRSKPEQVILALLAEKTAEVHEEQEDVLLLLATEDLNTVKARLVQHLRGGVSRRPRSSRWPWWPPRRARRRPSRSSFQRPSTWI